MSEFTELLGQYKREGLDFCRCKPELLSFAFAALSFMEEDVGLLISLIFKGCKSRWWKSNNGAHFHGIVYHESLGYVHQVNRGTDGDSIRGKLRSWASDANIFKTKLGAHKGFWKLAEKAKSFATEYLGYFDDLYFDGISQGAGVAPLVAFMYCDKDMKDTQNALCSTYATPPCGNEDFAFLMMDLMSRVALRNHIWINPQDPIASKKLRNAHSILLNGVDPVQKIYVLPDINKFDAFPLNLLNHSPSQYAASLNLWMNLDAEPVDTKVCKRPDIIYDRADRCLLNLLIMVLGN